MSCADLMHFTPSGGPAVFCRGMCKLNPFTSTVSTTVGAMFEVRNDSMGGKSGPDSDSQRPLGTFCKHSRFRHFLDYVGTSLFS